MKTLLIIGLVLFAGGLIYGATTPKNKNTNAPVNIDIDKKGKIASGFILTGFALMILSGLMYLNK